jgi:transketolase C-terminal domain/subunit
MVSETIAAAKLLVGEGFEVCVYSLPTIKPISDDFIKELSHYGKIITIEENEIDGGMGSALSEAFSKCRMKRSIGHMGLPNHFIKDVGDQNYLRRIAHLDKDSIMQFARIYMQTE